jgi:hypothetical protein
MGAVDAHQTGHMVAADAILKVAEAAEQEWWRRV